MTGCETMNQKAYFDCVNIAKLFLALAIVVMHCALVPYHSLFMTLVCRLGVPYFFIASGFFLQRKCHAAQPEIAVKGYLKRLFLPYFVFSIVWIIQLLIDDYLERKSLEASIISLIQSIIFYPRGALWYVWASIIGVIMLYPFMRKKKLLLALPFGIAMFMIGLLANNYYFLADGSVRLKPIVDGYLEICLVSNNAPFVGFVFLLIGMLMCEYYDQLKDKISVWAGFLILLISCALLIYEDLFLESKANSIGDGAFYLSQLVYVPAVFYLTTRIKLPHISRGLSTLAKNLSTGIYFLHVPILWVIHRSAAYVMPQIPGLARFAPLFDHASVCFVSCFALCLTICLSSYRHPKSFICRILK